MRVTGYCAMLGIVLFAAGCPGTTPPASAVLEGDWQAVTDELVEVIITFDEDGVVVQIKGTAPDGTTATITISGATTTLDGSDVTINVPLSSGDVEFTGTLSEDENTMTGTLNRSFNIGDNIVVEPPDGDLTLNRVEEDGSDPCEGVTCDAGQVCEDGECVAEQDPCANADAAAGEAYYTANCMGCHGADATGGFGPNIQCASAEEITVAMATLAVHGSLSPTAVETCDLEAYLNSFAACAGGQ